MNKVIAMGELLIDFTAQEIGKISEVSGFSKNAGGAPANVAICVKRLGGHSALITKLGNDGFGDFLFETIEREEIDVSNVLRDTMHHTPLAFVALDQHGEREFVFLRQHSSDLFIEESEINEALFHKGDIFHFGSVDLVPSPTKESHRKAIDIAHKQEVIVSFDPNLRPSLWPDLSSLIAAVNDFIPLADILKMSEEELLLITGERLEKFAIKRVFRGFVQLVVITRGARGATLYSATNRLDIEGEKIKVVDTTGAGDSFIGAFLLQLLLSKRTIHNLEDDFRQYESMLMYANHVAAYVCQRHGAIPAMPFQNDL